MLLRTDMPRVHLDFETRSPVDLRTAGVHRYCEHPATSVILFRYRFGSYGPVGRWRMGEAIPQALVEHVAAGGTIVAHNAAFERTLWNKVLCRDYPGLSEMRIEQMDCTMSRCAVLGIPQGLDFAAQVLGLEYRKDKEGQALMMRMCRPRSRHECSAAHVVNAGTDAYSDCPECHGTGEVYTWWEDEARIERLGAYCEQDVIVETAVEDTAPPLSAREREVWEFDQRVNDRGIKLDIPLINRLIATVEYAKKQLDKQMNAATAGFVTKATQAAKIAEWITLMGVPCTSVAKGEQEELLLAADRALSPAIREVIEIRQQAAKSSTAKLKAMLACVCADGRARGQFFYHAALSGRWGGRLIQVQNLYRIDEERDGDDVQRVMDMAMAISDPAALHDAISLTFSQPMTQIAKTMRSMIVCERGAKLVGGDKSNIEGRLNAWVAGEEWKLSAFRDYDAGNGPDIYRVAYSRSFGIPVEQVGKGEKRQVGKVQELALGYQGSIGAFISMGKNYKVRPADVAPIVMAATRAITWDAVAKRYEKARNKYGLPENQWTALSIVVAGWRESHPRIVQGWWDLQDAAIEAAAEPGRMTSVFNGRVRYVADRGFLWCALPSGRLLAYHKPRVITTKEIAIGQDGEEYERWKKAVHFDGYDSEKHRYDTFSLYGGMQCAHVVSGTARDLIVDDALEAERRGYPIVATVHDETISEVGGEFGSAEEIEGVLSIVPKYTPGLPLAAAAWQGVRY